MGRKPVAEKIIQKMQQLAGKRDLLKAWEEQPKTTANLAYVRTLKRQVRTIETQLEVLST